MNYMERQELDVPIKCNPKSDIELRVTPTEINMEAYGGFEMVAIKP